MATAAEKNRGSWNDGAAADAAFSHMERFMARIAENPANAFHHTTWETLRYFLPTCVERESACLRAATTTRCFLCPAGGAGDLLRHSENQLANNHVRVARDGHPECHRGCGSCGEACGRIVCREGLRLAIARGATATHEEVDRMHDRRNNPMAAPPNWIDVVAEERKNGAWCGRLCLPC